MRDEIVIIAVSSSPGGGKSTLCKLLADHYPNSDYIDYDLYQQITDQPIEEVLPVLGAEVNYDLISVPELVEALQNIKAGRSIIEPLTGRVISPVKTLFFETPFGRAHSSMAGFINCMVWIDVPLDLALARNFREFLSGAFQSSAGLNVYNEWATDYLSNYIEHVRPLLIDQRKKIINDADIVIDGSSSRDEILSQFVVKYEGLSWA